MAISAKTGAVQDFPRVAGQSVYAIEGDGAGGWFVGGEFSSAGGVHCRNLVRVRPDRTVDPGFCPRPGGMVRALARVGGTLYAGGTELLAAYDVATGKARAWHPGPVPEVFDLSPGRGVVYVTGEFTRIGGQPRRNLAAVSLANGRATRFAPNPDEDVHGDSAVATVVAAGSVYAWGIFSRIGGLPRDSFARLDPVTGHARPTIASPICPTALLVNGPVLLAGTSLGCEASKGPLRALSLPNLKPITWHPALPRLDVEALGAAPGLIVAVSAKSRFEHGPRTITGLSENGRRLFTSPVHPTSPVHAVAVGGGLVLVGSG
jgi:Domain of unknown function (DUF5122) beta-propeller